MFSALEDIARLLKVIRAGRLYNNFFKVFASNACHARLLPDIKLGTAPDWAQVAISSYPNYRTMKNMWSGEVVICMGTGPSLEATDLSLLNNHHIIGTNYAYRLLNTITPKSFHLVIQDSNRFSDVKSDLRNFSRPIHLSTQVFLDGISPPSAEYFGGNSLNYFFPKSIFCVDADQIDIRVSMENRWSWDPRKGLYLGHSVIFSAIQLAAFFGASRIICIGIDMDYSGRTSFFSGVKNIWNTFSYELHCHDMFVTVRRALESKGIEILNATEGGKVTALPRATLRDSLSIR